MSVGATKSGTVAVPSDRNSSSTGIRGLLARDRWYWILAGAFWVGLLIHTLGMDWSTDFRFHTSAIAEFATNLTSPRHIFLPEVIPHHSLSLYHQAWGAMAAALGISAISATQIAAMVNATALLIVFPMFVRVFVNRVNAPAVALLVVLLAWGPESWRLSSLLNLNSLGFGLPYPSYFATWTAMGLIVVLKRLMDSTRPPAWGYAVFALSGFVVSNAHLIVFGSYMILAGALVITKRSRTGFLLLAASLGGLVVGGLLWPYFSLFGTATESGVITDQNFTVYRSTAYRLGLALLGVIALIRRFRRDPFDSLVFAFGFALTIFLAGYVFEVFVLGRVLVVLALTLHLALADWLLDLWESIDARRARNVLAGSLVVVALLWAAPALVRMVPTQLLPDALAEDERLASRASWAVAASPSLGPDDVVLARAVVGEVLATTGAKTMNLLPAAYVDDVETRSAAVDRFFEDPGGSEDVVDLYDVTWVAYRPVDAPAFDNSIDFLGETKDLGAVLLVPVLAD